jgi:hypothetical protein
LQQLGPRNAPELKIFEIQSELEIKLQQEEHIRNMSVTSESHDDDNNEEFALDERMFVELDQYNLVLADKIFKTLVVAVDPTSINEYLYEGFPEYGKSSVYALHLLVSVYSTYTHLVDCHEYSPKQKRELIKLLWSEKQTNLEDDILFGTVHLTEEQVARAMLVYQGVFTGIGEIQMVLKIK